MTPRERAEEALRLLPDAPTCGKAYGDESCQRRAGHPHSCVLTAATAAYYDDVWRRKMAVDLAPALARDLIAAEEREARATETYARALRDHVTLDVDGNAWCAVLPGFVNVQESPCGFGDTPLDAICDLYAALDAATEVERG